jgi:hypothetical protein
MKKVHLLSTVAAVLLLTGAASAQDMKKDAAPAPAPAAQQKAPAEKIAPSQHLAPALHSERKTPETTGQAPPKEPEQSQEKPEMKGQMDKDVHKDQGAKSEMNKSEMNKTETDKTVHPQAQTDVKTKSNETAAQPHNATTGQGAAAGSAKLSTQQRTKISAVIRQHHVAPTHLNVSVRVGTRVPESVHFYPLPEQVYVIYPEWRGYDYILVGDEIVVIDPATHEIVAVLEA